MESSWLGYCWRACNLRGYQVYKFAKSNYNPDPYARPGQKKQGRENKEKKGWKSQSNKRDGPSKPKNIHQVRAWKILGS